MANMTNNTRIKCPQCHNITNIFLEDFRYMVYCGCCGLHVPLKVVNNLTLTNKDEKLSRGDKN